MPVYIISVFILKKYVAYMFNYNKLYIFLNLIYQYIFTRILELIIIIIDVYYNWLYISNNYIL